MSPTGDGRDARRVQLGDQLALVFEGRDTLAAAVELASGRGAAGAPATGVAEAVGALTPQGPGLLATLFLDAAQAGELARVSVATAGVERRLFLDVAGARVAGTPLLDADDADEPAAWAVWFPLDEGQRVSWLEGADVAVGAEHSGVPRVQLTPEQRRVIASDL
ncbi:MAG TPA: DUF3501 family protein [Candidatus Dormibacteraeota bacterium]|nr:DUF3501 family protein [Candidatus Dormibacteraeota bacterium]